MRYGSAALIDALRSGSFDKRWYADVVYNGTTVIQDVPLTAPKFDDDGTSLVQGTGSCSIVYQDDFAASVAPSQIGDLFSPFGTVLNVSTIVTNGDGFRERTPIGQYLIAQTPSIVSERFWFQGRVATKGDVIGLNLKDLFYGVQRDRFDVPGVATDLSSVWREYQRLTELPITRSIPDGAISASVVYQEDKLQACYDLAAVLDAVAYVTPDGTASMRPNTWPAVVDTIRAAKDVNGNPVDGGTLVSVGRTMANDDVYNSVVIRTDGADKTAVLARADITDGPLRVRNADGSRSPYRKVPYFYSSPYVTSQLQAQQVAAQMLPRVSRLRSVQVQLTEFFNPLREVGDVVKVERVGEQFTGRVLKISRSDSGLQTLTVVVNP